MVRTGSGEMSRGSDVAEGTLPLRTVLFKVVVGSTLEATPVVKGSGVASTPTRGGELGGDVIWYWVIGGDRVGQRWACSIRRCRKD